MPDIYYLHDVGCPTSNDENGKADKNPIEDKIFSSIDKIDECYWDRKISERDETVGKNVEPNNPRVPFVAHAMRHKLVCRKEPFHKEERKLTGMFRAAWRSEAEPPFGSQTKRAHRAEG